MKLFFSDTNDPRTFLYRSASHKWMGVKLNFAHRRAYIVFIWTITAMGVLLLPLPFIDIIKIVSISLPIIFVSLPVIYLCGVVVYYYFMAEKERNLLLNCPEKIKTRVSISALIFTGAFLVVFLFLFLFCRLYLVFGYDLGSGRQFLRFAIVVMNFEKECRTDPDAGITIMRCRSTNPYPEYSRYQLYDSRHSPVYFWGNEITFYRRLVGAWDVFGMHPFSLSAEMLGRKKLNSDQARRLHREMIDIYHSGLSYEEKRQAIMQFCREQEAQLQKMDSSH